ncbi:MAG: hypothetical protein UT58_C0003G0014 [Microgenomates group bacterium GW2011_GWC1_39_7b]|uniref:Uncharacterized protein n=1 Tax=Candidatus Woesebacteria bacterium GW2011_GWA2_40_7 TaxID=1618562 RepID=A0A0G0TDM5_9BACT|nr:MAG: hypothetical protein UT58_C0003G0014 [Microgenomates group bacterium GW2011_GWC1_39_7b]KKR72936.1 MAG: hypothetical protein UU16_C0035G0017 [Candidatus Woesebacteria bacterium GW2011_GWA2_40_7]
MGDDDCKMIAYLSDLFPTDLTALALGLEGWTIPLTLGFLIALFRNSISFSPARLEKTASKTGSSVVIV